MALVRHSSARSRLSAPAVKLNGRAAALGPLANGIWLLIWSASSGATGRMALTSGSAGRAAAARTSARLPGNQSVELAAPASAIAANRAGGWAVQLGAFKSEAEANKLRDRVRGAGIAAFAERNGSGDQALWRVRAGPYADRQGAETARASIKAKLQSDGMIVTQP